MLSEDAKNVAPDAKSRLRLWLGLLRLTSNIQGELKRKLRVTHGTTLPKFDVLSALARHPEGLKMSELSDYLKLSNGNVTGLIDRLTEDGFVLRASVPGDRRAQMARLTPEGSEFFANVAKDHEAWIDELLSAFSGEDAAHLVEQLKTRSFEEAELNNSE